MSQYKPKYYSPDINAMGSAAYTRTIRPPIKVLENVGLGYGMITKYPNPKSVVSVPKDLEWEKSEKMSTEVVMKRDAEKKQVLAGQDVHNWYTSPGIRLTNDIDRGGRLHFGMDGITTD